LKYFIAGIERCGTTSLEKILSQEGHDIIRMEWLYCFADVANWIKLTFPDYQVVLIKRDPVERCFSDYTYAIINNQIPQHISYLEAIEKFPRFIQGSYYEKWIEQFDNPKIFELENLKENQVCLNSSNKRQMTLQENQKTLELIEKNKDVFYQRNWDSVRYENMISSSGFKRYE